MKTHRRNEVQDRRRQPPPKYNKYFYIFSCSFSSWFIYKIIIYVCFIFGGREKKYRKNFTIFHSPFIMVLFLFVLYVVCVVNVGKGE